MATMAAGTTVLENVAKEPHVVDVANFLNPWERRLRSGHRRDKNTRGKDARKTYMAIPDQIEAGTCMIAAAPYRAGT